MGHPILRGLITSSFPKVSAAVVASEQLTGFEIDGDEFAVAPYAWILFVGHGIAVDGVTHGFEFVGWCYGELLLEVDAVGKILIVEAGSVGGLLDVEAVVDGADDVVGYGGDDGRTARGAHDEGQLAGPVPVSGGRDDGWRHGGERTMARSNGVGRALNETVHVGDADL